MKVLLDANVLFPTVLREILLACAAAGLFRPLWSPRILEEWARATVKLGPGAEVVARGEIAALSAAWPGAAVTPKDGDLRRLWLPDPDDVHVLAAAVAGSADLIVTLNAKDFPRHVLAEEGLERLDPDQFLLSLHAAAPDAVAASVARVHAEAERLAGEPLPAKALLKRARLPRLGKALARDGALPN
ncbi:RSP_2648 family PIN domain-containing protein [Oceaniglobus roseus]|uniref:RSP_2648 family PIN domain-containing protein n=1 Tax=Oceaniglobus roseus TaxID=1737570 RepID=UPI000C7EA435|nr:PIN domain-containing protein [Kandeliimicrobium roseum]